MNDIEMTALQFLMRAGETRNSLNACCILLYVYIWTSNICWQCNNFCLSNVSYKIDMHMQTKYQQWQIMGGGFKKQCSVKNVLCQYLYTIQPYKIRILEYFRSHLSIFLFPFSFHLGRGGHPLPGERGTPPPWGEGDTPSLGRGGHPLPVQPGRYFGPRTMRTYFYNFVVTNLFCQYLYTIQPYKIRILEYFRSHLSIFLFPFLSTWGGGHPLSVPPPLGTSGLEQGVPIFTILQLQICFVNIYIQYSLTKYGFWSASEVI